MVPESTEGLSMAWKLQIVWTQLNYGKLKQLLLKCRCLLICLLPVPISYDISIKMFGGVVSCP